MRPDESPLPSAAPPPSSPSSTAGTPRRSRRDVDNKRALGLVSCAECRRSKTRCDRKLPCGTCVRRGCPNICPTGTLSGGPGSRIILADTQKLHQKISEMSARIRQLEDSLGILQSSITDETHPLLQEELLLIKFWPEPPNYADAREKSTTSMSPTNHDEMEVDEPKQQTSPSPAAGGALALGVRGDSKYLGRSSTELLLYSAVEESQNPTTNDSIVAHCMGLQNQDNTSSTPYHTFPFLPLTLTLNDPSLPKVGNNAILESSLPPYTRAWALCEIFFEQASWHFRPIQRDEFVHDIMTPVYRYLKDKERQKAKEGADPSRYQDESGPSTFSATCESPSTTTIAGICPHKLTILYLVFALGALMDLTLPSYNSEATTYYNLGRAAFTQRGVTDTPLLETLQAITMLALYHGLSQTKHATEIAWSIVGFGAKLAQSLGLHRDCARWGLDSKTVQKRRYVFWAIYSADVSTSLLVGRPPSTPLAYIDCAFPDDEQFPSDSDQKKIESSFWSQRFKLFKELFAPILELTAAAQPPSYETILDMDKRIREKGLPRSFKVFVDPDDNEYYTPSACLRSWLIAQGRLLSCVNESSMLYIHRPYFAQALLDHPENPLRSEYAPSYLSSYRSASLIIKLYGHYYERCPGVYMRLGSFWMNLFSATVIMGFVVLRTPRSVVAKNAFAELNAGSALFDKGAASNFHAQRAQPILRRLRDRAHRAFMEAQRAGQATAVHDPLSPSSTDDDDGRDDLALLSGRGQTRILVSKVRLQDKDAADSLPSSPTSPLGQPPRMPSPGFIDTSSRESDSSCALNYLSALSAGIGYNSTLAATPSSDFASLPGSAWLLESDFQQLFHQQLTAQEAGCSAPHMSGVPPHPSANGHPPASGSSADPASFPGFAFMAASEVPDMFTSMAHLADGSPSTLEAGYVSAYPGAGMDEQWRTLMHEAGLLNGWPSDVPPTAS